MYKSTGKYHRSFRNVMIYMRTSSLTVCPYLRRFVMVYLYYEQTHCFITGYWAFTESDFSWSWLAVVSSVKSLSLSL